MSVGTAIAALLVVVGLAVFLHFLFRQEEEEPAPRDLAFCFGFEDELDVEQANQLVALVKEQVGQDVEDAQHLNTVCYALRVPERDYSTEKGRLLEWYRSKTLDGLDASGALSTASMVATLGVVEHACDDENSCRLVLSEYVQEVHSHFFPRRGSPDGADQDQVLAKTN